MTLYLDLFVSVQGVGTVWGQAASLSYSPLNFPVLCPPVAVLLGRLHWVPY